MGKLTHNPIYYMKDNWENWPNLRHTLDRMYLASISVLMKHDLYIPDPDNLNPIRTDNTTLVI